MSLWQLRETPVGPNPLYDYQVDAPHILCVCEVIELVKNNQGQGLTVCSNCGRQWRLVAAP